MGRCRGRMIGYMDYGVTRRWLEGFGSVVLLFVSSNPCLLPNGVTHQFLLGHLGSRFSNSNSDSYTNRFRRSSPISRTLRGQH